MKLRLALAAAAFSVLLAGCGGGSSSGGEDVASVAPRESLVFVEGVLRPSGELKSNTDAVTEQIAGFDNLGDYIVSKLESSARDEGEQLDFEKEVEPWLGERGGVFFGKLQDGDLSRFGAIVESTDTAATQEFIDRQTRASDTPYEEASYEGVDFEFGGPDENAFGVVGDFLVFGEDGQVVEEAIQASHREALADEDRFASAISAASDGSLADVYVDVGGLIDESGGEIDPQARQILQKAGIDPSKATAVASVIPGSNQIEIDLSSDLGGEQAPSGDVSELLGSLPDTSFAAIAASGFGEQLQEALDGLDASGIPGTIPPHQLKKGVKELGVDLEAVVDSFQDAAIFAVGNSESSLGGALVLSTEGDAATKAVERAIVLLRGFNVAGVTVLGGKTSGFAIHSDDLGNKPLVVAAKEGRVDALRQPRLRRSRIRARRHADQRLRRRPHCPAPGRRAHPQLRSRIRGSKALPAQDRLHRRGHRHRRRPGDRQGHRRPEVALR